MPASVATLTFLLQPKWGKILKIESLQSFPNFHKIERFQLGDRPVKFELR